MDWAAADSATSWPSRASSSWMCGAPLSGFSFDILRIKWIRRKRMSGRPTFLDLDFLFQ
jgi:hypothetical protein